MAESPLYTEAQLITEVRTRLKEPTALLYSDTQFTNWMDMGARKCSHITLCVPYTEDISTTASTYGYTLTEPMIKVESVVYSNKGLQRVNIRNFGHGACAAASNTAPNFYFHWGNNIYLWPSPAVSLTVSVYGYRSAIAYSDATDTTPTKYEIPNALQATIIDFVLACAYAKAGKHSLCRLHMQEFLSSCLMYRRDVKDRSLIPDSLDQFQVPNRIVMAQ